MTHREANLCGKYGRSHPSIESNGLIWIRLERSTETCSLLPIFLIAFIGKPCMLQIVKSKSLLSIAHMYPMDDLIRLKSNKWRESIYSMSTELRFLSNFYYFPLTPSQSDLLYWIYALLSDSECGESYCACECYGGERRRRGMWNGRW